MSLEQSLSVEIPFEEEPLEAIEKNDLYEEELLPLIRALKPEGVSLEEYESIVMDDLYDDVKRIQLSRGILLTSPEIDLAEMKALLESRINAVTVDAREYSRTDRPEGELVKNARIALLTQGDYSDFEKYFGKNENGNDHVTIREIKAYLGGSLTGKDIEELMHTDVAPGLLRSDYYNISNASVSEYPESFITGLLTFGDRSKSTEINFILKYAEKGVYSEELFSELLERDYGREALQHVDRFENIPPEKIGSNKSLFSEEPSRTLRSLEELEESEQKRAIIEEGFKTYIAEGGIYNFDEVSKQFKLSRNFATSPAVQQAAMKGIIKGLQNNLMSFTNIQELIEYVELPKEELHTEEIKTASFSAIKNMLEQSAYTRSRIELAEAAELFGVSEEEVNGLARDVLPQVFSKISGIRANNFLHQNNITLEYMQSEELKGKVVASFTENVRNFNNREAENLIANFSFLTEGFPEGSQLNDIVFETVYKATQEKEGVENKEAKLERLRNIQESFWVRDSIERLPPLIQESAARFNEKYGKKGLGLIALAIAGSGLEHAESLHRKLEDIEKVLDKYDPLTIPEGMHVSMGVEYEVTHSVAEEYAKESQLGYKKDIEYVSQSANIGKGKDAVHEIAVHPTYNPYMLLAEMKLMQEAGLLDLNFEKYPNAARGYHLSLVGDNGMKVSNDMYFLNNVLTMTQLTGALAGRKIRSRKSIVAKSFEEFSSTQQKGVRCEMKGMGCDTIEQFEKAIIFSHHAGIAMQLAEQYLPNTMTTATGNTSEEFERIALMTGTLQVPFANDQERDIVFQWMKLKNDMVAAVGQHNESFVDSEFNGFVLDAEGNYIDTGEHIDIVRNKKLVDQDIIKTERFKEMVRISPDSLFANSTEMVNSLIFVNNLFLKPPQGVENSAINARAMLEVVKQKGYGDISDGKPTESIFERGGELRNGYYVIQGASEEMISHKSQIILQDFNESMEKLLQQPGVPRVEEENILATA
jgi:hypothetical protein